MESQPHYWHALHDTFQRHATRPALVFGERTLSYNELQSQARRGATALHQLGVRPGDRVALCSADKRAFLMAHLAVLYAGAVTLPLNPRFTREELRFFLSDSGATVALAGPEARAHLESMRPELPNLTAIVPDDLDLGASCRECELPAPAAEDPCLILYSSGTTGWPKGVVHTHRNVASSLRALQTCWRFTPDDVVLNVLPLFHIHGLCFATQLTLLSGACLIIDDFEPQATLQRIGACTVFMAVPTIYYRLLEQSNFHAVAKSWTKPRLFTCGSAPIRAEVLPELEAILGRPVINRYGMSEAFVIASLPLDGPWPHGSVGLPLDGIALEVDAERGQVGAVRVRGPNLFHGYWNKPPRTDDWFETGDLGSLDAAGFLTLVGRKNDLIITSGFNVYPQVVERVINECPGVRESAVFGVPDERKGERVVAAIVLSDPSLDEAQVRAFWNERLVDYQRPREIVFVEALPRNAMGKVLRRELIMLTAKK